ncbi:TlpA disulfide reductase family protein [Micromonospora sp. NPDC049559]|uniref:TlpA family protein disulfide reductase n=1 Tax=Micromonospora sp. NPDC049559 TaxID=3155923 RepID=UPI0034424911
MPGIALLALLGVVALGLALTATVREGTGHDGGSAGTSTVGRPAPPLAGHTLAGEPFDLAAQHGRVVLVNLFASWCGPCRDELPLLAAAQRRWSDRGLRVVGVDVRDSPEAVRVLLAETGSTELTVLPDPAGATAVDWGARGVPETFLVDRDGRVTQRVAGPVTAGWLDQRLAPLLAP